MGIRQLTALLRLLQRHGVTSYQQGDLKLTLGALPPTPGDLGETEGAADLSVPEGVFDPRKAIQEIYAKHNKAKGAAQ
jgi:hypothetical protein